MGWLGGRAYKMVSANIAAVELLMALQSPYSLGI
jgi:hypothetical protein